LRPSCPNRGVSYLVAAGALSRSAAVTLAALLPHARVDGGLAALLDRVGALRAAAGIALGAAIAVASVGWPGIMAALAVGAAASVWGWHCLRRLGGMTGDTLGAASEGAELLVLLIGVGLR
jgi:cobalamin synthase